MKLPSITAAVCASLLALSSPAAADKTTIKVWAAQSRGDAMQNLVEAFEKANPDIDVELTEFRWNDAEWNLRLTTGLAADDLPDVLVSLQVVVSWAISGFIQPVNDLVERDGVDMDIWSPAALGLSVFNDEIYALPFTGTASLLFYNKKLLEEAGIDPNKPPKDWAELMDYSDRLTKIKDGGDIEQVGYVADFGGGMRLTLYMYGNDGGFFEEDCSAPRLNDPRNVEALDWYVETYDKLGGAEKVLSFVDGVGTDTNAAFYSGRVGLYAAVNHFSGLLQQNAPDLEWGVWPHPANVGIEPHVVSGIWQVSMPVGAKHREEAWEFMKFAALDESANIQWVNDTGSLSLLPGISDAFADKPAVALALELLKGKVKPPNPNPMSDATVYIERSTATDLALRHTMSSAEALEAANTNTDAAYQAILADLKSQGITEFGLRCY